MGITDLDHHCNLCGESLAECALCRGDLRQTVVRISNFDLSFLGDRREIARHDPKVGMPSRRDRQ